MENKRNEDHFVISGLTKVRSGLSSKEWQVQAQRDVMTVIASILNREPAIRVVHNQTGTRRVTTYLVQMVEPADACSVRSKFGSFFAGGRDSRPSALKEISIGNFVTPATKVISCRVSVMPFCLLLINWDIHYHRCLVDCYSFLRA